MEVREIKHGRVYRVEYFGEQLAAVVVTGLTHGDRADGVKVRLLEDVQKTPDEKVFAGSEVLISASQVLGPAISS